MITIEDLTDVTLAIQDTDKDDKGEEDEEKLSSEKFYSEKELTCLLITVVWR